jgi:predicted dehydrogenase
LGELRLRVGVVGCGLIAQVMHLPYLRELSDRFQIAAICDLSPTILERVGSTYGVARRFTDWRALLAEPLDAVMVLTSGSHAPVAIAAALAGRHVFVEKPLALSPEEGREMVAAGERAGVHLMVGYMKRYDPAYERLAEELTRFSDLRFVLVTTLESPLEPYVAHYPLARAGDVDSATLDGLRDYDERQVTRTIHTQDPVVRQAYRAFLLDSMVHELNAVRGLLGNPDRLEYARVDSSGVTAMLSFSAVRCAIHWVNLPGIAQYRQELAFFDPQRRATLVFPSPFLRSMPTSLVLEGGAKDDAHTWRTTETVSFEEAFKLELVEFHRCVVEDREPRTPASDALQDLVLCQAIVAAHLDGRGRALGPVVETVKTVGLGSG